jgi:hypothetical protein
LNRVVNDQLEKVAQLANSRLASEFRDPAQASDTEAELAFAIAYRNTVLKKFGERLLPLFGACIESNDCPGWPGFERIVLEGKESIYGESNYNRIAIASLAPTFKLCGVRVGTDKLTHLFSNGFFYYNASRQKGSRLENEDDVYRQSLEDEHGLMGARSTAVVSDADARATRLGYRLAKSYFEGDDPVFARSEQTGLLEKRRPIDVCRFVPADLDEAVTPPIFTARPGRRKSIKKAIAERIAQNEAAEASMVPEARENLRRELTARALPADHGRLPFFYKLYIALKWFWAYVTIPRDAREAIGYLVFPKWKLDRRTPIVLRREPSVRPSAGGC